MIYLLFNPKANNSKGEQDAREWAKAHNVDAEFISLLDIQDMKRYLDGLKEDDEVILTGGDGTVNWFANDVYGYEFKNKVYYAKCGSGNDFWRDNEARAKDDRIDLRPLLKNLPLITVNGIQRRFLNGIGYGLDGETCRVGDIQRATSDKPVNYSSIAIKLLLGGYKLNKATVTVDGVTEKYENVWLASTMKGRFYGGGLMVAPDQDRLHEDGLVTSVTIYKKSRLITLMRFPSLNKGEHVLKKDWVTVKTGKKVTVSFEEPCALQIDGDVIENVLTYTVETGV
ncbi:MAG: diacylglycerol kinase family protein [Clostridiales bacterium]|nr:diacylglycerol kinase family protein [Clostridiales bacterium]